MEPTILLVRTGGWQFVEADDDEIMYKVAFDLPDVGLPVPNNFEIPLGDTRNNTLVAPIVPDDAMVRTTVPQATDHESCRSAVSSQLYDEFAPRMAFLQLGMT